MVITTAFIGFLVAGFAGATVAAVARFFPCYVFTIVPAPLLRRYGQLPAITAVVQSVTAGAIGAIAGAVLVLGRRSVYDIVTALVAIGNYAVLRRIKLPEPIIVLTAAALGLVLYFVPAA